MLEISDTSEQAEEKPVSTSQTMFLIILTIFMLALATILYVCNSIKKKN